jgi:hypothetical protein
MLFPSLSLYSDAAAFQVPRSSSSRPISTPKWSPSSPSQRRVGPIVLLSSSLTRDLQRTPSCSLLTAARSSEPEVKGGFLPRSKSRAKAEESKRPSLYPFSLPPPPSVALWPLTLIANKTSNKCPYNVYRVCAAEQCFEKNINIFQIASKCKLFYKIFSLL